MSSKWWGHTDELWSTESCWCAAPSWCRIACSCIPAMLVPPCLFGVLHLQHVGWLAASMVWCCSRWWGAHRCHASCGWLDPMLYHAHSLLRSLSDVVSCTARQLHTPASFGSWLCLEFVILQLLLQSSSTSCSCPLALDVWPAGLASGKHCSTFLVHCTFPGALHHF